MEDIEALENWVQGTLRPDLTMILNVPVEVGLERTRKRGEKQDRFEKQALAFKHAVHQVYVDRANNQTDRIKLSDATGSIEQTRAALKKILQNFVEHRSA